MTETARGTPDSLFEVAALSELALHGVASIPPTREPSYDGNTTSLRAPSGLPCSFGKVRAKR